MVLWVFHGNFMVFSRVFQGLFKESSRAIQGSFAGCSKGCQGCSSLFLGSVSKVFRGRFKKMFNVFLKNFIMFDTHCSYPSRRRACSFLGHPVWWKYTLNKYVHVLGTKGSKKATTHKWKLFWESNYIDGSHISQFLAHFMAFSIFRTPCNLLKCF